MQRTREQVEAGLRVAALDVLPRQRPARQRAVRQQTHVALPRRAHLAAEPRTVCEGMIPADTSERKHIKEVRV